MYPMNNYLIIKEVKTEDSSPAGTESTLVLYRPPADSSVRKYRVISGYYDAGLELDDIVWAKVADVIELADDNLAVKYQDLIAKDTK